MPEPVSEACLMRARATAGSHDMQSILQRTIGCCGAVWAAALWLASCHHFATPLSDDEQPPSGGDPMSLERNKALARRIIEDAFNRRHPEAIASMVHPEFRSHNPRVPPGPNGLESFARGFIDGFADFVGHVRELVAEGDKVVVWVDWQGTHTGSFAGVAATGRRVEFATVEIFRFDDGKLAEHWDVVDRLALQTALGLVSARR
jgi:predicted ester cyclase